MEFDSNRLYQRYATWRRYVEVGYWVLVYTVSAIFNSITEVMDVERRGLDIAAWEPVVWETSSAIAFLALLPLLVLFTRWLPPRPEDWRRVVVAYALASLVYSLAHVLLMVGMREAAYAVVGRSYDFG